MPDLCCDHCDYKTNKTFNLNRHMIRNHSVNNVNISANNVSNIAKIANNINKCDKCDKNFTRNSYLKVHSETCQGKINPLQCIFCNKLFAFRSSKAVHQKNCKAKYIPMNNTNTTNVNNITNNNNCNNNITNNITVNNYNFRKAPFIGITHEIGMEHINLGSDGVRKAIDRIYFDDNFPSLIELHVDRTKIVRIKQDGKWIFDSLDNAVNHMKNNSIDQVCNNIDKTEINKCIRKLKNIQQKKILKKETP